MVYGIWIGNKSAGIKAIWYLVSGIWYLVSGIWIGNKSAGIKARIANPRYRDSRYREIGKIRAIG